MKRRAYQSEALKAANRLRLFCLLWERQGAKTTTQSDIALKKMMKTAGATVIYASASLTLGQEMVLKQTEAVHTSARELVLKDANVMRETTARFAAEIADSGLQFQTADAAKDKQLPALDADAFADLFESQRLEFRVYHDRTRYSRTKVIAPNVATARGWTGTVLLDEIGFIRHFMELWVAIEPIISTSKDFQLIMSTTPPQDDTHASFELLAAPAGVEFKPNPAGNWYESEAGIPVLRADAFDTYAAGKRIYDLKSGKEITPEEAFRGAINKDGWRLNHGLQWLIGGTAACNLLFLKTAQARGVEGGPQGACECFQIDSDADFDAGIEWLAKHIHPENPVGLGFDVATTTKGTSNPSVCAIVELNGADVVVRAFFIWKTSDPDVARERLDRIVSAIEARPFGAARALAIDATNEKYFAEDVRRKFAARLPVLLMVSSEKVEKPGLEKPTNWKEYLGDQYVGILDDNKLTLPAQTYIRLDHRMVKKDRGKFVCDPAADGKHGDTFDAGKLAAHAVLNKSSGITSVEGIVMGGNSTAAPEFQPHYL